jgi:DNA replication protein DnaC
VNLSARLSRIDVLVIDDRAMAPLSEPERRDFWKICEDRYPVRPDSRVAVTVDPLRRFDA